MLRFAQQSVGSGELGLSLLLWARKAPQSPSLRTPPESIPGRVLEDVTGPEVRFHEGSTRVPRLFRRHRSAVRSAVRLRQDGKSEPSGLDAPPRLTGLVWLRSPEVCGKTGNPAWPWGQRKYPRFRATSRRKHAFLSQRVREAKLQPTASRRS